METITLQVKPEDAGARVDVWLAANRKDLTRSAVQRLLEEGRITCAGRTLAKKRRLSGGELLEVRLPDPEPMEAVPQNIPLDVVYEDGDVIVVNKPKGLVVHPAPGHPDGPLVPCCITAAAPSPVSAERCAPALSTASTGIPPVCSSPQKTTLPTNIWPPSSRITPWPGSTAAS